MLNPSSPGNPPSGPPKTSSPRGTKRPFGLDESSAPITSDKNPPPQQQRQQTRPANDLSTVVATATAISSSVYSPPSSVGASSFSQNGAYSSFRNVSACNRCRLRKNRCDQRLPRCQSCEKAGVHCVGYDPATKREIPRSYVFFLESRVRYLEKVLKDNNVPFRIAEAYEGEGDADLLPLSAQATDVSGNGDPRALKSPRSWNSTEQRDGEENTRVPTLIPIKLEQDGPISASSMAGPKSSNRKERNADREHDRNARSEEAKEAKRQIDKLLSNISMVSVHGASDPRYLGSTSGISFARVVFAAVRSSVSSSNLSERSGVRPSDRLPAISNGLGNGSSIRDSFFGLQARPSMKQAPFPDQNIARRLVTLYFEYANPQVPILHRGEFMELFHRVYSVDENSRAARDLYVLNIVCAIGAGIIFDVKGDLRTQEQELPRQRKGNPSVPSSKRQKFSGDQSQPEEYHASAVVHLESCLSSSTASDGFGGGLEELQAVLLLASFALLRPVAPGLWYIVGVAVRLAIDLGLHYEDGAGIDSIAEEERLANSIGRRGSSVADNRGTLALGAITNAENARCRLKIDSREVGRREWIRDLRRRLWWCVYSFDRLVSTCVGRPFGITDQVITTEFPSLLDDDDITKAGFLRQPAEDTPSYKHVAHHYFKLRLLQSEIQQVLQYQQTKLARRTSKNYSSAFMHTKLPCPFLQKFDSFRSWRADVHRRLTEWKEASPAADRIGVQFSVEFLELNYWQTVIILYRQSLTAPFQLVGHLSPADDASSPSVIEDGEDEDDIYVKIAEAGQKVLRLYRQLHRRRLVNYTYLSTHHLFMAGISFLYAIWHSPVVRNRLTIDDIDLTVLCATSVLGDLIEKCPPAEACRDAFERMSKATVQMFLSAADFVSHVDAGSTVLKDPPKNSSSTLKCGSEPSLPLGNPTKSGQVNVKVESHHALLQQKQRAQQQKTEPDPSAASQRQESDTGIHNFDSQTRFSYNNHQQPVAGRLPSMYTNTAFVERQQEYARIPFSEAPPLPFEERSKSSSFSQSRLGEQQQQQQQSIQEQYTHPHHFPARRQSAAYDPFYPPGNNYPTVPGLEFLDTIPFPSMNQFYDTSTGLDANNGEDVTTSWDSSHGQVAATGTGLDLGFGMAVDFQHDWSEGAGFDLFDHFFFGGATGNGNMA